MKPASKWLLYGPFLFAAVALCAWWFLWRAGAHAMREALDEFTVTQAASGARVNYEPLRAKGFPFFLRGIARNFSIESGDRAYSCAQTNIDALPYQLDRIVFSCTGAQLIKFGAAQWTISAPDARASIERDSERGWIVRIQTGAAYAESSEIRYAADSLNLNLAPEKGDPATFDISLRAIAAHASKAPGARLDRIDAAIRLGPADAFETRRIDILGFEAHVGESVLKASGAAYSRSDSLNGRLEASLEKPAEMARAIAAFGSPNEDEARAIEAGLAMLAVAWGGTIAAPIIIEDGVVSLAGVRLGEISQTAQP
ncbi:MAG: DUF2125 domain-containing protein [Parvularculaceae bacterium]|nr:DUF2125 domain-containing protein [Parvularculaceae bacterium]